MWRSVMVVLALLTLPLLYAGCDAGSNTGSGLACETDAGCAQGERCILTDCNASTKTCQVLCNSEQDCTGVIVGQPSGTPHCLPTDTSACPVAGQSTDQSYCVP